MKKIIWIVSGSEDGIIGCYTTVKSAYAKAKAYIESSGTGVPTQTYEETKQKLGDKLYFCVVDKCSNTNCEVEGHYLNENNPLLSSAS